MCHRSASSESLPEYTPTCFSHTGEADSLSCQVACFAEFGRVRKKKPCFLQKTELFARRIAESATAAPIWGERTVYIRSAVVICPRMLYTAVFKKACHNRGSGPDASACLPCAGFWQMYDGISHGLLVERFDRFIQRITKGGVEFLNRIVFGNFIRRYTGHFVPYLQCVKRHIGKVGFSRNLYLPTAVIRKASGFFVGISELF